MKLCDSGPNILLSTSFTGKATDKSRLYCCNQTWNLCDVIILSQYFKILHISQYYTDYIPCNKFHVLHISQWVSPRLHKPFSSSLKSRIFSFDLTKRSFSVFGLHKATPQVDKNTALNLGRFWLGLSRFLMNFLYSWNKPFGSHYERFLSYNPYSKLMF